MEGELLVLGGLLDGESGPLLLQVQVTSVSTESSGINGGKVDLALELLGEGLDHVGVLGLVVVILDENVGERDTSIHVTGVGLRANLTNERSRGDLCEVGDLLNLELTVEDVLSLIEGLEEDNSRDLDTGSLSEGSIVGSSKEVGVTERLGNLGVGCVGLLVLLVEEGDENNLVGLGEIIVGFLVEDGDGGEGVLNHVRNDSIGLALSLVGRGVIGSTEDLDGGVALDTLLLAKVGLNGTAIVN